MEKSNIAMSADNIKNGIRQIHEGYKYIHHWLLSMATKENLHSQSHRRRLRDKDVFKVRSRQLFN